MVGELDAVQAVPRHWGVSTGVEPWAVAPGVSAARIMVVDDTADVRDLLRDYLELEGYTVDAVGSAAEALKRLAEFSPGVVLLDIRMPGLSGLSALQEIRARHPEVGVIMVTGVGDRAIAGQSLALGAFDYVTKPIDFAYLLWSIQSHFVTRQVLRELGARHGRSAGASRAAEGYDDLACSVTND